MYIHVHLHTTLVHTYKHTYLCSHTYTYKGHVEDLAVAMANVIGKDVAKGGFIFVHIHILILILTIIIISILYLHLYLCIYANTYIYT